MIIVCEKLNESQEQSAELDRVTICRMGRHGSPDATYRKRTSCFYDLLHFSCLLNAFGALGIVIQQLFNQVDMCQEHSSAAVPLETQFIQSITVEKEPTCIW